MSFFENKSVMSNTGLAGEWEEWKWGIKLQGENFLIMTKISFLAVSFSQSVYCHKCHNSLNVSTSVKYMKYHDLFIFLSQKWYSKQFKCIQKWDLIGMVSFTWYSVFQKWQKGTPSNSFSCSNNMEKETDYCWIHVPWFQQNGKKPHAQPSGSGLFVLF